MKKIITLLLALSMVASTFLLASCNLFNSNEAETSTEAESQGQIIETVDSASALGLPAGLKFDETFTVLIWKSWVDEFGTTPYKDGDAIQQSVDERDAYVSDLLDIEFIYERIDGNYEHRYSFLNHARNSILVSDKAWDLIGSYSMIAPQLALEDMTVDLRTVDYIDFEKPWYAEFMVDACTINDQTYFITGDISTNSLYAMQAVAFNATEALARGIDEQELYQMVYNDEWTIENMFALCQDLGQELDGDGVWDAGDFYPIITSNDSIVDSFYYSSGLTMISESVDGKLKISDDVLDEPAMDIYASIYAAKNTYKSYLNADEQENAIKEKKCIFSLSPVVNFRVYWSDSQERFRVLPFPKYSESDPYRTYLSMWYTQYCIPSDVDDPDYSAAVIEALGYANYHRVTPLIFEETMKLRYSENEDCANMFDIMRNGRTYEISSLFGLAFEGLGYSGYAFMRDNVAYNRTDWVSNFRTNFEGNLQRVTDLLNEFYYQ